MREIRKGGGYAKFEQELFDFHEIECNKYELVDRNDRYETLKSSGFKKYNSFISYLEVKKEEIIIASHIITYGNYKSFKFLIENFFEGKYILRPLEEAQIYFKDFERHGYDPVYEVTENELQDIWEERTPIEGFKFDVEPIYYIKKNGKYLDKSGQ